MPITSTNFFSFCQWLTALLFKTLIVWYLLAVFLELLLPGIISNYLNLDIFIWTVIIVGLVQLIIRPRV